MWLMYCTEVVCLNRAKNHMTNTLGMAERWVEIEN